MVPVYLILYRYNATLSFPFSLRSQSFHEQKHFPWYGFGNKYERKSLPNFLGLLARSMFLSHRDLSHFLLTFDCDISHEPTGQVVQEQCHRRRNTLTWAATSCQIVLLSKPVKQVEL